MIIDVDGFTQNEVKILKQIAKERLKFERIFEYDKDGNAIPLKNRFGNRRGVGE